jgi:TP901 family phage tail tape measure protein
MAVRTISTKLAVEGEAEYKQKIASCNSELKTLKSSLALVQSEYKNNANSMEALTAKGEALSAMQTAQAKKVAELEKALENCQKAQTAYADRVAAAEANVSKYEQALAELKDSTGDTSEEQAALTAELEKWKEELANAEAGQNAAERGVENWQQQLNKAKIELNETNEAISENDKYLDEAKKSTDGCATSIDKFGNKVKDSKDGITQLAAALAAAGVAKSVKEIADALMECSQAAAGFETALAKVSTLADTSVVSMDTIKAQLVSLSGETGVAVESLAEATYQALSAGVDTANVVDFVSTATKLSVAGFTESATAVDVVTTALNAYGLAGSDAEKVASMLVKTQDLGKTSVGELAATMGRVIPTAAAYNVSLDQLSASYAIITASGTNTAIATTNLGAMFNELASEGGTVATILEEQTGKSFAELMADGASLGDVISILSDSVDGNSTAFSNLWSSTTAGQAALTLLNQGSEKFNDMRSRASLSRPITRHSSRRRSRTWHKQPWPPLSSLPLWPRRDRSTTPRRRRTPRSLPNGPIPLHIRPERSASTRAASIVASRLTPHRRIGRRTPRRACGPRSPIPPKSGRSGPSPSGPMTHIAPGPRSPTLKRNGRPISTITYGSPGFTGGRRLRTWTL